MLKFAVEIFLQIFSPQTVLFSGAVIDYTFIKAEYHHCMIMNVIHWLHAGCFLFLLMFFSLY